MIAIIDFVAVFSMASERFDTDPVVILVRVEIDVGGMLEPFFHCCIVDSETPAFSEAYQWLV